MLHLAVLEPDLLPSQAAVWSGGRRAGKEWDAFKSHHAAREILTEAEFDDVQGATMAVLGRREFGPYLAGPSEVSIEWECEGVLLKSRLDKVSSNGALLDLKKTRDASPEAFGRQAHSLAYHAQAAFYADAWAAATGEIRPFVFLAVEAEAPYASALYVVGDEALEQGRNTYGQWLAQYRLCEEAQEWPSYQAIQFLQLPRWSGVSDEGFKQGSTDNE